MGKKMRVVTGLIISGILVAYIHQMAPAPLLGVIRIVYGIQSDAILNLSISIINPAIILASLWGANLDRKIGTARLYSFTLVFLTAGMLFNFVPGSFMVFLIGRTVFGFGFGLGIPFIGSAIMKWYDKRGQEKMNTVNGVFPYVGTVISMGLFALLYRAFDSSLALTMGIWGVMAGLILIAWQFQKDFPGGDDIGSLSQEKNLYTGLWKRRDIRLLCGAFFFDFFCYQYIVTVLPTFYMEAGGLSDVMAGTLSAVAFPAVGIFGAGIGGAIMSASGKRKPSMQIGQIAKFIGMFVLFLSAGKSLVFVFAGTVLYAIGNSMWMPGMYMMGMEQDDMTPSRAGAAFALISSCGFAAGAVSPVLGGWITDTVAGLLPASLDSARHMIGLNWSLFLFSFTNILSFFCIFRMKETGRAK